MVEKKRLLRTQLNLQLPCMRTLLHGPPPSHPSPPADLFAIIKATEKLERAYVRDAIGPEEYEVACERLIQQFKVLHGSLRTAVRKPLKVGAGSGRRAWHMQPMAMRHAPCAACSAVRHVPTRCAEFFFIPAIFLQSSLLSLQVPDVEKFMSEYNMQCPMAATRLIHSGLPATIEHKSKQR
jgi:hypothetical protein